MIVPTLRRGSRYRVSRHPPADLRGRPRADRVMALLGGLVEHTYLAYVEQVRYNPGRQHRPGRDLRVVLTDRRPVARDADVVELTFRAPDRADLPDWQPGCHLDVHLPSGLRRQYSLCGSPVDRSGYTVAVRRIPDGGGGSLEMHSLAIGTEVAVRGPRNGFPFVSAGSALFLAGGIGITPIIAMVRAARAIGMDWRLIYTGRSRESMPFLDEVELWEPDRVQIRCDDEHGLPSAADLLGAAPAGGAVYCCGPTSMLAVVRGGFADCAAATLHFERFSPPPVRDGRPLRVELARTGRSVVVAADESVLAAVRRVAPDVAYSCQQGFCGTCRVRVLAGRPEHRDHRLTAAERADGDMLICVSRAAETERLVLDL